MTANSWRWLGTIGIGLLGGFVAAVSDSTTFPGWYDLIRHGLIGVGTAIPALKISLTPKM